MTDTNALGLRDWFACHAFGGLLSSAQYPPQSSGEPVDQFVPR